ncbi:CpaD family pilus assembly protein [Stakelama tenebrarum]|uniref:Pilus assembly protein CpaD n=1 Tax=Stakelama tenebrarum TaxID=2711215 RepID=A0A6G6Y2J5_9SPHN|nr:CpaD family pilus assembly protein [Sphingosinithalassobacter tenebrarum]QIG79145.1 pilus assembly protein CpaD [Sphingosinithalassobacter tenebrarum]
MTMRLALPALLAPALLLSACGGTYNGGVDSIHQPVVTRSDYAFDLATAGPGLATGEAERLAGWMASLRVGYGDVIAIDDGDMYPGARRDIAEQAARYGLLISDQAPVTTGAIAPGTVRVVVTRMTASVPGCPDHSREYQPDFSASTSSNFGCAVNSNLAAMVANPGDLVRGQPGSQVSDPVLSTRAIQTYRDKEPTGAGGLQGGSAGGGSQ